MEHEKILRINELKAISRERDLSEAERAEQAALRQEYIEGFRANMKQVLDSVLVKDPDGTVHPLEKKEDIRS